MKTKVFISCLLICAALCSSCKSSAQTAKNKTKVDSFTKIASSAGIDVYFTQGSPHTVEIETDEETLNKIEIVVKNGNLELKRKKGEQFKKNVDIKAYVTAKQLEAVAISGGADFIAKELKSPDFLAAASGGADVRIEHLKSKECKIAISGGADCYIDRLDAEYVEIAASGGSDATVTIDNAQQVNAAASGGADITIKGKTADISAAASGGADINLKGLTYKNISEGKSGGGDILR